MKDEEKAASKRGYKRKLVAAEPKQPYKWLHACTVQLRSPSMMRISDTTSNR